MKRKLKSLLAWLFAVSILISTLPTSAVATESAGDASTGVSTESVAMPAALEAVTTTVSAASWPDDSEQPEDITIRIANIYLPDQSGRVYLRVELTAPETSSYSVNFNGESITNTSYSNGVHSLLYQVPEYTLSSSYTFTMVISNYNSVVYEEATLSTYIASHTQFHLSLDELNPEPERINKNQASFSPSLNYPLGTALDAYAAADLSMKLVKDGVTYAADRGTDTLYSYGPYYSTDTRYADLFQSTNYNYSHYYAYKYLYMNIYRGRALNAGTYDVHICDKATGETIYVFPAAVTIVDEPVVNASSYVHNIHFANMAGADTAYVQLTGYGALPEDFTLTLSDSAGNVIGTSSSFRITGKYTGGFTAVYYVPLSSTVLESDTRYNIGVSYSGGNFYSTATNPTLRIYSTSSPNISMVRFSSHYYANALVQFSGAFRTDTSYKFELSGQGALLGTAYAYPDENGLCDIAFLNSDGAPVEIEPNISYSIKAYYVSYGNWQNFSTYGLYNSYVENFTFPDDNTGEETVSSAIEAYSSIENGKISGNLYVYAGNDDYAEFSNTSGH